MCLPAPNEAHHNFEVFARFMADTLLVYVCMRWKSVRSAPTNGDLELKHRKKPLIKY